MRARMNALKHGMRAKTLVLPDEDADAFQARLSAWNTDLKPADDVERFLVTRAVQLSWQLERADRALAARAADARTAADGSVERLVEDVIAMGRRLFWDPRGHTTFYPQFEVTLGDPTQVSWSGKIDDPDDPARLMIRLESTAMGCAWLLDRWAELREVFDDWGKWQPPDRFKAIRLLGRQPLDIWEDKRVMSIYLGCAAMDPDAPHQFKDLGNELRWGEGKRLLERLNERRAGIPPRDAETGKEMLLSVIAAEEERLEELLAHHLERQEALADIPAFDDSAEGERLRRYQATCDRALLRMLETLRKRRKDAERTSRQSSRPAKAAAPPDTASRMAGLLNLATALRAANAANKANDPFARGKEGGEGEPPCEPLGMADETASATNEPNEPPIPREGEPPCEPLGMADETASATNEPNEPPIPREGEPPCEPLGMADETASATNEPNELPIPREGEPPCEPLGMADETASATNEPNELPIPREGEPPCEPLGMADETAFATNEPNEPTGEPSMPREGEPPCEPLGMADETASATNEPNEPAAGTTVVTNEPNAPAEDPQGPRDRYRRSSWRSSRCCSAPDSPPRSRPGRMSSAGKPRRGAAEMRLGPATARRTNTRNQPRMKHRWNTDGRTDSLLSSSVFPPWPRFPRRGQAATSRPKIRSEPWMQHGSKSSFPSQVRTIHACSIHGQGASHSDESTRRSREPQESCHPSLKPGPGKLEEIR